MFRFRSKPRQPAASLTAGFALGVLVTTLAFYIFGPGSARPAFVTHLQWRVTPPHVGIQAGHARTYDAPDELAVLRNSIGAFQDDWGESIVNLDVARRVVALLQRDGLVVDLLPTTIPSHYRADVFVALHADAAQDKGLTGFKVTRSDWSTSTLADDRLVAYLVAEYAARTGLPEHRYSISDNMMQYYVFNYRKFEHSLDPSTPAAIIEMGFLTNSGDRRLLREQPDTVAAAVASGVTRFLETR